MKRIILSIVWGLLTGWAAVPCLWAQSRTGTADREIWVKTLVRLADPVLSNLANETLKKEMPYESLAPNRQRFFLSGGSWTNRMRHCSMAGTRRRRYSRRTITQKIHRTDGERDQQCSESVLTRLPDLRRTFTTLGRCRISGRRIIACT